MPYTEEEIKKYLEILNNYTSKPEEEGSIKAKCCNCQNSDSFTIDSSYKICDYCGVANGHVLGFYDVKITIDYILEKRVFIIGSVTMRKRLIIFPK